MPQDTDWIEDDPADRPDPALDKAKTALRGASTIGPRKAGLMDIIPEFLGGVRESTIDPMAETIMHPINAARTLLTGKGAEGAAKILQSDVDTLLGRTPSDPTFQNVPIVGPMVAGTYAGVRQPLADASTDVTEGRYGSAARNVGKMAGVVAGLIAPEAVAKKAAPTTDALAQNTASSILERSARPGAADAAVNGPRQGPPAPPPLSPMDYVRQTVRGMLPEMPTMTVRAPERAPKYTTKYSKTAPAGIQDLPPDQIDPELVPEEAAPEPVSGIGPYGKFTDEQLVEAVKSGKKPSAILVDDPGKVDGFTTHKTKGGQWIVAKDLKTAKRIAELDEPGSASEVTPSGEAELGKLLGYDDPSLRAWHDNMFPGQPFPGDRPASVVDIKTGKPIETPQAAAPSAQSASPVTREAPAAPAAAPAPQKGAATVSPAGRVNPNLTIPDNPGVKVSKPPADFPEDLMTRGEKTGNRALQVGEKMVEGSVAGANRFENLRLAQQKELTGGYAERILDYMSGKRGTAEEVGAATQDALASAKQRIKAPIYDKVNEMGAGAKVQGAGLRKALKEMKSELTEGNLKIQLGKDSTILKVLDTGIDSKGYLGFNQLRAFRTQVRSLLPAARKEIGTTAEMHINRILGVIDESIEKAAGTKPGLLQEYKTAQGKWADLKQTLNDSTVGKILKQKDPGKVHTMLKTAPLEDLRKVRELVGEDQFSSLKARLVEDMMNKATEGELRPSGPVTGLAETSETTPRFTGSGFRKQLESLGEERLNTLFDKTDLDNMYKLSDVAERIGGKGGASRLSGLALNLPLLWGGGKAVAQALTGDAGAALTTALKTGSVALGTNLVARVMARKGGPTMLRKLAEAVESGNSKLPPKLRMRMPPAKNRAEAAFWGARVGTLMAEENAKKNAPSSPEDWEED